MVEKPAPEVAPSRLGVAGRYILTPGVFHEIRNQPRGVGGEIQLTDGIAGAAAPREGVRLPLRRQALRLRQQGRLPARPTSSWRSQHPKLGPGFREYLKRLRLLDSAALRQPRA